MNLKTCFREGQPTFKEVLKPLKKIHQPAAWEDVDINFQHSTGASMECDLTCGWLRWPGCDVL